MEQELSRIAAALQQAVQMPAGRAGLASSWGEWLPQTGQAFFQDVLQLGAQQVQAIELLEALRAGGKLRGVVLGCDNSPVRTRRRVGLSSRGIPTIQLAHAISGIAMRSLALPVKCTLSILIRSAFLVNELGEI